MVFDPLPCYVGKSGIPEVRTFAQSHVSMEVWGPVLVTLGCDNGAIVVVQQDLQLLLHAFLGRRTLRVSQKQVGGVKIIITGGTSRHTAGAGALGGVSNINYPPKCTAYIDVVEWLFFNRRHYGSRSSYPIG